MRGPAVCVLALLGVLACSRGNCVPRDAESGDGTVEGVHFTVAGGNVIIDYHLAGDPAKEYSVRVFLRKGSDSSFRYAPRYVSGDVGVGRFGGRPDQVVWSVNEEFPRGIEGKDYYFEVHAEELKQSSGLSLGTVLGVGAAVLGVTATYVLVSGAHQANPTPVAVDFPQPPGRPK